MRFQRPLILFVCLIVATATASEGPEARRQRVERSIQPEVLAEGSPGEPLADRMEALAAPGLAVAVIEDFEIDWVAAYGEADPDGGKLTPDLRHNVGSVSKTVCALTALRLVEMGKLSLDAPINTVLERWKLPENEFTEDNPVTLRHLLSHSGGTTVHGFPGYGPDDALPTISQLLNGEAPANSGAVRVNRSPGEGYRYSGGGTTIAQLAIEEVTGRPFAEVARELVLEPLGMKHSTYVQPVDGVEIGARTMGHAGPEFSGTIVFTATGAAGLWSTAEDLARLMIGVMRSARGDEGALLKQETAQQLLTPVAGEAGLGFFIGDHDGERSFGHGGDNTGFHAQVWALDATGRGAVTLVNSDAGRALQFEVLRAVADVYEWPEGSWEPRRVAAGTLDKKRAKQLAGRYRFGAEDVITVARSGKRLTYRECYWDGRVAELLPLANGNLLLTSSNNEFGHNAELAFDRDADGAVTAMRLVGSSFVMPRMADDARSTLEYVEAGKFDEAIAAWKRMPDLSVGLMRYGARRLPSDSKDGRRLRAFNAEQFPLHEWAQEMHAEVLAPTEAKTVRDRFADFDAKARKVSEQLQAGSIDDGLAAFDRLAEEIGSNAAYDRLVDEARSIEEAAHRLKVARRVVEKLPGSANAQEVLAHALFDNGDRPAAIDAMERSIALRPRVDNTTLVRMWVRDRWEGETATLTPEQMALYAGSYGPRQITIEEGKLFYSRGGNTPRELVLVGEHQFMLREENAFRMEIVIDDAGKPTKIIGHYQQGRTDESPADE